MAQSPGEVEEGAVRTGDSSTAATVPAPTTDDIRSQIEQTRAEMSDTIDAIQTRLSPTRAIADVKDSIARGVVERARDNPLAVGLLATAAVGLIMRAALTSRNRRRRKALRTRMMEQASFVA